MPNYTTGIPTAAQSLGITQQPIQDNFTVLDTTLSVNHVAMNTVGAGKHKFVQMPIQASAPTTLGNEGALYTKNTGTGSDLYYIRDAIGATETQLTSSAIVAPAASVPTGAPAIDPTSAQYITYLPGGLIMISGYVVSSSATQQVNFPITFSAIYTIQLTRLFTTGPSNRSFHQVTVSTFTSFTFRNLDANGNAANGFSVMYQVVGTE